MLLFSLNLQEVGPTPPTPPAETTGGGWSRNSVFRFPKKQEEEAEKIIEEVLARPEPPKKAEVRKRVSRLLSDADIRKQAHMHALMQLYERKLREREEEEEAVALLLLH